MILSNDEIKNGLNYHGHWLVPNKEMLAESHLEANARIRELEAQAQEWHERYVICCEDSRLEKEALRNELIDADTKIRELEAENKALRDHGQLTAEEVKGILDGNAEWLDKRHAEIDAIEDRADSLAVIADTLAEALDASKKYMWH